MTAEAVNTFSPVNNLCSSARTFHTYNMCRTNLLAAAARTAFSIIKMRIFYKVFLCNRAECQSLDFKIVKDPAQTLGGMLPKALDSIAKKYFIKNPHFNSRKCRSCGRCEQICPAHIINMEGPGGTAQIVDKTKCIHCFCCHEICSFSAIKLRRF